MLTVKNLVYMPYNIAHIIKSSGTSVYLQQFKENRLLNWVRSPEEISEEKTAIKFLRGDFAFLSDKPKEVMEAARKASLNLATFTNILFISFCLVVK